MKQPLDADFAAFLRGDATYPRMWAPETPYYAYRVNHGVWAVRRTEKDGSTTPWGGSISGESAANMVDTLNGRIAAEPRPEQGVLL